ncbi:MAG: hypothetical protein ABSB53_08880 [Nitrososphaerales archaeon]
MPELAGYRGKALEFLTRAKASIGDVLEAKTEWGTVTGTLVPRYQHADDGHVVLKLKYSGARRSRQRERSRPLKLQRAQSPGSVSRGS